LLLFNSNNRANPTNSNLQHLKGWNLNIRVAKKQQLFTFSCLVLKKTYSCRSATTGTPDEYLQRSYKKRNDIFKTKILDTVS